MSIWTTTDVPRGTKGVKKMSDKRIEKSRVNMYFPTDLKNWLWEQANENGFNLTTMVQMIVLDYKKQKEALDMTKIAQMMIDMQKEIEYEENNPK